MKNIIIGLIAMSSLTAFAVETDKSCTTVFGQRVCANIEKIGKNVYIQNIEPNVPASKATATKLCLATGLDSKRLKVSFKKKQIQDEKVLVQVKCKILLMARVGEVYEI